MENFNRVHVGEAVKKSFIFLYMMKTVELTNYKFTLNN